MEESKWRARGLTGCLILTLHNQAKDDLKSLVSYSRFPCQPRSNNNRRDNRDKDGRLQNFQISTTLVTSYYHALFSNITISCLVHAQVTVHDPSSSIKYYLNLNLKIDHRLAKLNYSIITQGWIWLTSWSSTQLNDSMPQTWLYHILP